MKHEVVISETATLVEHAEHVVCDLADSPPGPIALGLTLLEQGLVEAVTLRPHKGRWVIRIRTWPKAVDSRLSRYGDHRLELALPAATLGYCASFFLKFYRDGQAEVDHLDLETTWPNGARHDVVIKVAVFAPPIVVDSIDDAIRVLGLPEE